MGYYWLPTSPSNIEFDNQYTYLTIVKPELRQEGKKQSRDEVKEYKEQLEKHKASLKKLEGNHINLYNNPIEMTTILDNWASKYFDDFSDNTYVYKIKPTSSKEVHEQYSSKKKYMVWEFDIAAKITNRDEFIKQIVDDDLLQRYFQNYFISKCYGNPEYKEELINFLNYIHEHYSDNIIYLSDIVRQYEYPYEAVMRNIYDITRENIRFAVNNGFVSFYKEYDDVEIVLRILLEMCLFDIALQYVKSIPSDYIHYITDSKLSHYEKLENVFKNHADENEVKEILKYLDIKLSGVSLTVTKIEYEEYDRENEKLIETVRFDDVGQAKSYLIKKYDVPFEEMKKDINDISFRPDEYTEYKFNLV